MGNNGEHWNSTINTFQALKKSLKTRQVEVDKFRQHKRVDEKSRLGDSVGQTDCWVDDELRASLINFAR
jgi:hypothetical protein